MSDLKAEYEKYLDELSILDLLEEYEDVVKQLESPSTKRNEHMRNIRFMKYIEVKSRIVRKLMFRAIKNE